MVGDQILMDYTTAKQILVWIDDESIIELDVVDHRFDIWWEQEPMRPLGIATWNTGAAVRNIELREIEGGPEDAS